VFSNLVASFLQSYICLYLAGGRPCNYEPVLPPVAIIPMMKVFCVLFTRSLETWETCPFKNQKSEGASGVRMEWTGDACWSLFAVNHGATNLAQGGPPYMCESAFGSRIFFMEPPLR